MHSSRLTGQDGNNRDNFILLALKSEISKKLIKQYLSNRKNDAELQSIIPAKTGKEGYLQNMIKLINFEVDNLSYNTPAT